MHTEPEDEPDDVVDRVSGLMEHVLAAPPDAQQAVLEEVCARHPDCADALRRGYDSVRQLQLAGVGHAPDDVPRTLGPFRLLELLGGGGMGAVYRAEDSELRREVALKLVRPEWLHSQRTRARFQRESEALARVDHPGLCTVYRAGETAGQPWIAMRLVRGPNLAETIQARRERARAGAGSSRGTSSGSTTSREELEATLRMFETIAGALDAAHTTGVVHRDIKPANIVLAGAHDPVVVDFGLVHLDDSDSELTISGDHIGTPTYMAPEQVEPHGRAIGPRTDVYALAVTLFETLTLESPYVAHSREELFHCIVRGERRRLRGLQRGLPADLDVVLDKALDPDPDRRYASMADFAEDLRRVRAYEPTLARRPGFGLRVRRWCQRNPVAATFLTLLSVGLATTLGLYLDRQAAQRRSLAMSWSNLAGQLVDEHPEHALWAALRGVELERNPETLGLLLRTLDSVQPHETWKLPWPEDANVRPRAIVISPAGASALILGKPRGEQRPSPPALWRDGANPIVLEIENGTHNAHWSSDGRFVVTTWHLQPAQVWSDAGELVATIQVPNAPADLEIANACFLPGGEDLVLACNDGIARIRRSTGDSVEFLELSPRLFTARSGMPGLAVSADGSCFALGDRSGQIVVHRVEEALQGLPGRVLTEAGTSAFQLDLDARGDLVQVYDPSHYQCTLWNSAGRRLATWGDRTAPAFSAPLDPTGARVLQLLQARAPLVWESVGEELAFRHALGGRGGAVRDGAFRRDGEQILTVTVDGSAHLWNARTGHEQFALRGLEDEVLAAGFLGAGESCLLVNDETIHRYDLRGIAGPRLTTGGFADFFATITGPGWSGEVLTADTANRLALHAADGRQVHEKEESIFRRADLRLARGGRWLVSTSWNMGGRTVATLYGPDLEPAARFPLAMRQPHAVFGPVDQLLVVDVSVPGNGACVHFARNGDGEWSRSEDDVGARFTAALEGTTELAYDAPTGTLAVAKPGAAVTLFDWRADEPALAPRGQLLVGHDPANLLAFAPDGRRIAVSGADRVVRLCDLDGRVHATIAGFVGILVGLEISPKGDRVLTASTESGAMIWDLEGRLVLPVRPRTGATTVAAFLPDGERVLIGATGPATWIVPIDPERIVDLARRVELPPIGPVQIAAYQRRAGEE